MVPKAVPSLLKARQGDDKQPVQSGPSREPQRTAASSPLRPMLQLASTSALVRVEPSLLSHDLPPERPL